MQKEESNNKDLRLRLAMRITANSMSFSIATTRERGQIVFEEYPVNRGISTAANLREAFESSELLQSGWQKVLVLVDSPVMLVPIEELDEDSLPALYSSTFSGHEAEKVVSSVLPELNVVAAFGVNKDVNTVLTDHFSDIRYAPLSQPVWQHLYRRSFASPRQKLYVYFHDHSMEVFAFRKNRFRFYNAFRADHAHDALYYLLYAWRQLGMDAEGDELHLLGAIPHAEWLQQKLHQFLRRCFIVNVETEMDGSPLSRRKDIPYDVKALYF